MARLLLFKGFISAAWGRRAAALVVVLLVVLALGVARLRIVEAAVSATVVRVLHPVANAIPPAVQPIAMRSSNPPAAEQRRAATTGATAPRQYLDSAQLPAPATPQPPQEREAEAVDETSARVVSGAAAAIEVEPPDPTLVTVSSPTQAALPPAADAEWRSTWGSPADAGVAIGRGTKKAGVATAGAFTRFAKKIAGSF